MLVLIALPIVLLGTCSPWAIRLAVTDVEHAGRVAGRLYALSTAGSLFGTMIAALVLIPLAGSRRTFLAFALVAWRSSAALGLGRRYTVLPLAFGLAARVPPGTVKTGETRKVLYEGESRQQFIRVLDAARRGPVAAAQRGPGRALPAAEGRLPDP